MAIVMNWRDVGGGPPNNVGTYTFNTDDNSITLTITSEPIGSVGEFHPPVGTLLYSMCEDGDLRQWKSPGDHLSVVESVISNSAECCTLSPSSFSVSRTNNTDALTPNGTISVTTSLIITDYEASIDGGDTWVSAIGSEIPFTGLSAATYNILIREISGVCSTSKSIIISDNISYPPLIISPADSIETHVYSPVFYPILAGYELDNNQATVKEDVNGTYLEVDNDDANDYLATLPIIKIINNEDYEGTYQITGVDDVGDPTKFYFSAEFTTEQNILFLPFDRQIFHLFAEKTSFNVFEKVADITVYSNSAGIYLMRLEGFLQSVFKIQPPINNGYEITLLRKYYVMPKDFDVSVPAVIYNAVYSAVPDLTPFLSAVTPLGPAPINFINEQTQKGYPVLFSFIDTVSGRIKNVTSSEQTHIVETGTTVFINALVLNQYDLTWVNPDGAISDLQVSPPLPSWITIESSPEDTVQLSIDTGASESDGDYEGLDYDSDDYLSGGPNTIVGCYEFEFSDGLTPLFTLQICVFPIQKSNQVCVSDPINIAWINQEGGWSSYIFEGRRTYSKEIGDVTTFKAGKELRRSRVENVYDAVEVNIANKNIKDLIFISSLRQSIQAYLYDEATMQWSIPIIIDKKSFPVYSKPFKQIEVSDRFTFRLSEEIIIQTQ